MIYKVISTKKGFLKQSWCFVSCLDSRAGTWINFPPQLAAPMPLFLLRYAEIGPLMLRTSGGIQGQVAQLLNNTNKRLSHTFKIRLPFVHVTSQLAN